MQLVVRHDGTVKCVYAETIDLASLGSLSIRRGSHVEPTADGRWTADLSPVGGPVLGPFMRRNEALEAEINWLEDKWLTADAVQAPSFSKRRTATTGRRVRRASTQCELSSE